MSEISVIMPVYNCEKYLKESVESILNQSYKNFEFIIINDGSTDKSLDIINEYKEKDGRIKVISWKENKGLVCCLNEGVKMARGEYIARMDADDISMPERLEKQLKYVLQNDLTVCGTWAEGIDDEGHKIRNMDYPPETEKIKVYTLLHSPFIHPSVVFRKDIFEKVGGYKKFFKHIEDYELWTRIVFKYKTGNLPERLLHYRIHDEQITRKKRIIMLTKGAMVRSLCWVRKIINII